MRINTLFSIKSWLHVYYRFFIKIFYIKYMKIKGVSIDKSNSFLGTPLITKHKSSEIIIGKSGLFVSNSIFTALGVKHRIILRTLSENANIVIGNGVRVSGTTICARESICIGDRCVIGADVIITDTDFHSLDAAKRSSAKDAECALNSPVVIGEDVFIGANSIILKGVTIGANSIIGAGSVVTKPFPENSIIAGNPARLIKKTIECE